MRKMDLVQKTNQEINSNKERGIFLRSFVYMKNRFLMKSCLRTMKAEHDSDEIFGCASDEIKSAFITTKSDFITK